MGSVTLPDRVESPWLHDLPGTNKEFDRAWKTETQQEGQVGQ